MTKYLFQVSYTLEGVRGLIKEGGSSRNSHFKDNVVNSGISSTTPINTLYRHLVGN